MRQLEGLSESAAHGFLGWVDFETALASGAYDGALECARTAAVLGARFDEPNLRALGILGEGRVLVRQGRVAEGMALLDEAMLAAMSPELNPTWAGTIYCHLMVACHELADLRRSAEWTRATKAWCESMPGAGPFLGVWRVHRAQALAMQGEWEAAESEVRRVCEDLPHFDVGMVAEAHYELGEARRRRGDLTGAEESYREAHRRGRDPQPGLALVRLALGNPEAAAAAIDAFLETERDRLARVRHVAASVEVALALNDLECADRDCEELEATAAVFGTSGLQAIAAHMRGATLLSHGQASEAVPVLRRAFHSWHELPAPYEAARVRELLAVAAGALGDHDTASLEREAATAVFRALRREGARPGEAAPAGLTPRELEVLLLAAEGRSNADIAETLVLSVRTVERHLATVYSKLGFAGRNSRAAAVSFALREGLHAHPSSGPGTKPT